MEMKRTTEILIESKRRFVVNPIEPAAEQTFCPICTGQMFTAEQIAQVLFVSRRTVYSSVETKAAHFSEIEGGSVLVCLTSLAAILDDGGRQLSADANTEQL